MTGSGESGFGVWCSKPSSYRWKEADRAKIGCPCCTARTRRAVKERPSFIRWTVPDGRAGVSAVAQEVHVRE
ncbi:hypothetical protein SALBM311S_12135 [Streptomyces alboniger]